MDEYRTLQDVSQGLYREKGSRFIALAMPVGSREEVKLQLEQLRKKYHDARHYCYAYRLGAEPFEIRYNDDGEPSGTAGKPILGQIQSSGLTNVLIVVVRYFGGIKLGTGGLIHAYRAAAKDAVDNAQITTKHWITRVEIRFSYARMNAVMKLIKEEDLHIIRQDLDEVNCILLDINISNYEKVMKKFLSVEISEWTVI